MAEAAAAFGLAVNVLQIVDFGTKFVTSAWKIWRSGKEGFDDLSSLERVSQNMKMTLQKITDAESPPSQLDGNESNGKIFTLAKDCGKVAERVISSIESLGIPDGGRKKRDACVAAFKLQWKANEIQGLQVQLDNFRSQIMFNLVLSSRFCLTMSIENQNKMLQCLEQSRNDNKQLRGKLEELSNRGEGLGSMLISYLDELDPLATGRLGRSLRDRILNVVYNPIPSGLPDKNPLTIEIPPSLKVVLEGKFLSKLQYYGMKDRALRVADAHGTTFRWIFETGGDQPRPWTNFRHWLESDQKLYWITGKAGSGKSTLMKFITESPLSGKSISSGDDTLRCTRYLLEWAKNRPLLIATFYFWVAGSTMQTSEEGLYRTLLSQVLRMRPDAIPHASPERWEALCLFNEDPRPFQLASELKDMLIRAISFVDSTMALCLFIDGLDEFDGQHNDLVQFVKETVERFSVKICVASRPWVVFEDALKDKPSLLLEDLTHDDIEAYVTSRFRSDHDFSLLEIQEREIADALIESVVRKAQGVFLWVNLVVSSLLTGIKYGDRVCDLQRRLDQLPTDLETLYDRILSNLDPFYHEHASQYFSLMIASPQPPTALLFSFSDEDDPDFALNLTRTLLSDEEIRNRMETLRKRLNSRCRGLLAIPKSTSNEGIPLRALTVQYLHRTVKDYVEKSEVKEKISAMIKSPFDPHLRFCSGLVACFKTTLLLYGNWDYQWLTQCMQHASRVSGANVTNMIRLLDELQIIVMDENILNDSNVFKVSLGDVSNAMFPRQDYYGSHFLSLAVKHQVVKYVENRAQRGCLVACMDYHHQGGHHIYLPNYKIVKLWWNLKNTSRNIFGHSQRCSSLGWPLLLDATPSVFANPAMIAVLLVKGADPNFILHNAIYTADPHFNLDIWMDIIQLMILHGANIGTKAIESALKLVHTKYSIDVENVRVTISGLVRMLRAMKSGKGQTHFSLKDAEVPSRMRWMSTNLFNIHLTRAI